MASLATLSTSRASFVPPLARTCENSPAKRRGIWKAVQSVWPRDQVTGVRHRIPTSCISVYPCCFCLRQMGDGGAPRTRMVKFSSSWVFCASKIRCCRDAVRSVECRRETVSHWYPSSRDREVHADEADAYTNGTGNLEKS